MDTDVSQLISQLNSLHQGEMATARLVACGARAVGPLREFLLNGRPSGTYQPRCWAVEALAALGAKDVLLEYLIRPKDISDPVARFGEEAVESAAARELAAWPTEEVFQFLLEMSRRRMLNGLIESLAAFGRPEAIPYFDRALEDDFYRPAAEQAFRQLGAAARRPLALSAATPLPAPGMETPSSRRRRRSVVRLLAEIGIGPEDWPTLRPLLEEDDPELVAGAARMAADCGETRDAPYIVLRLMAILPKAEWHLQDEIEEVLVALGDASKKVLPQEIASRRRLSEPRQVFDRALRTLLRVERRLSIWLVFLLALGMPVLAQGLEGQWLASIPAGATPLRLVLHVTRAGPGFTGTLDSIDQGAMGLALGSITQHGAAVKFELKDIKASFEGTLSGDAGEISGQWKQGGMAVPVVFRRSEKLPEIARPQEPRKPYPYDEEEVSYENAAAKVRFAGTLTLPRAAGPHPAVLLITGSGPQDRNESIAGHKPFLVLADYLTRRGIAVLRVDDRGVGGSTGKTGEGTTEDFAGDALAGVAWLKSRKEINARRIGLVGHSEGGLIAPLAATRSGDVAFIVMMAGPGIRGEKLLELQGDLILRAMGVPEEIAARNRELQRLIFEAVKQEKDAAAVAKRLHERAARMKAGLSPDQQKSIDALIARAETQLKFAVGPWFRHFLVYDPKPALEKVKAPVLAVNGEKDLQVPPQQNLPAIVEALEAGHNADYAAVKLAGLNHLFQTCTTGAPAEYSRIEETIAPAALEVIGDWIVRHVR